MQIKVFTDGASRGNPGPGGWAAIILLPQNKSGQGIVKEIGGREAQTTNNRMELIAVIKSLDFASKSGVLIYTDSKYVMNGASAWINDWQKNGWKTKAKKPVENQDLWKKFLKGSKNFNISWKLLPGHSGIPANDRCDQIATAFADNKKPKLYSGPLDKYLVDIYTISATKAKPPSRRSKTSAKAYSYVSMVNGVIKIHKTWSECEKRVKGVSKAKFKKSVSLVDEQFIISEFSRNRN